MKKSNTLLALAGLLGMGAARADYRLNLTEGVTELSRDIHDLHMLIFWICVVIGVLVYGLLAALTLGMISTSMGFVTYHDPSRSELWGGQQVLVDEPLVEKTIKELSDWKIGNPIELKSY